jgi:hypothetical protein
MKTESIKRRFSFNGSYYYNAETERIPVDGGDSDASVIPHCAYRSVSHPPVVFINQWNVLVAKELYHVVITIMVFI